MITSFNQLISQVLSLFQWWIVIAPWEMAIRVRRGRKITVLSPGMHFRIPALDRFFVQRVRKRYLNTPTQTVTTRDGKAITISGGTSYSVCDVGLLYNTLSDPEDVIQVETMGLIAQYVVTHDMVDVTPETIKGYVDAHLDLGRYGLGGVELVITDFVCVRTYRIINSNPKEWNSGPGLTTQAETKIGVS
jgi:hypothetical protein